MKKLAVKMQMIIGKKTRQLKEWEEKDPGSIECPVLECEIDDAKSIVSIINADAPKTDKLEGIKSVYLTTTSGSIYDAVRAQFKEEGIDL